ncbi:MAG TPA: FAD-binding and (Fe-S)-binding domain-containing protein [Humisphaera sp.]|nr:FAD-binding and (Fe-S)-binding domain-containing protein [Humisphaera sp.]
MKSHDLTIGQSLRLERLKSDDARTAIPESDAQALAAELRQAIEGQVRFDAGARALYSTDASNYRQAPIGVVVPRTLKDVETTIALARKYGAPILSRGGGTSLAGQCCNVAVVIDFSKHLRRILEIDPTRRLARVEPGCILDDLRGHACGRHGLTFGPDPETHDHCTLGGMLGNNSCGVHSLMSRNHGLGLRVSDNTHELDILTYRGDRFRVGETPPDELERIVQAGGAQGIIYSKLKALRDKYGDLIRARFPKLPRRVSGYNLDELLPENNFNVAKALVGTESTCVTILEATLKMVPDSPVRTLLICGYPDIYSAADQLLEILEFNPIGLEGIDDMLVKFVRDKGDQNANLALLPPGGGFLLIDFGGHSREEANDRARRCMQKLEGMPNAPAVKLIDDPKHQEMIWKVRQGGLGSTAWVPGLSDKWEGWEDTAVPVEHMAGYLHEFRALMERHDYHVTIYGHLGQGCVHTRIPFDLYTADGIKKWRAFIDEASDLVIKFGGSFSGEHGDGQARAEWLEKMYGPELMQAFREFKSIWDPDGKMNPGKVIDAYKMTDNLRLGADYNPPQTDTHFHYATDRSSFSRAVLRCVGVGKCRRDEGGTMCPSFMATHDEMHSTRGRSRMLFEMLNGELLEGGWQNEHVKESLDLCLSCKGCKGDCPVNVDIATYKAEFLSHYYKSHARPRHAYAFGWIHAWARLASLAPSLANFFTQTPGLSKIAGWFAGVDPRRKHIPPFAERSFKSMFAARSRRSLLPPSVLRGRAGVGVMSNGTTRANPHPNPPPEYRRREQEGASAGSSYAQTVILFPDTFSNYFRPDIAMAAVEVLEDAAFQVQVPMEDVCCGRPLYDYGFLDMARRRLLKMLEQLRPIVDAEIPIVVLEPSCWAVFKDELTNLLPPTNTDAKRLQNLIYTLADFLKERAPGYSVPTLHRRALLHGHCHQKSLDHLGDKTHGELKRTKEVLKEMGIQFDAPATGCCGMAGAFGYEHGEHYDVSIACGERLLLPAARQCSEDTLIIADGFSCREQIEQMTERRPLHLAQVIQLALRTR